MLNRSLADFGAQAQARYRRLVAQAFDDLQADPARVGVRSIDEVRPDYAIYHLRSSLANAPKPSVRTPRHLIAFYVDARGDVVVARVFHERQVLTHHLFEGETD